MHPGIYGGCKPLPVVPAAEHILHCARHGSQFDPALHEWTRQEPNKSPDYGFAGPDAPLGDLKIVTIRPRALSINAPMAKPESPPNPAAPTAQPAVSLLSLLLVQTMSGTAMPM